MLPNPQSDGLAEFSVVFTDRALNHMSQRFQDVMRELGVLSALITLLTIPFERLGTIHFCVALLALAFEHAVHCVVIICI